LPGAINLYHFTLLISDCLEKIIVLIVCIIGLVVLVLGVDDIILGSLGFAMIILPFFYLLKDFFKKKEKIVSIVPEEERESILSSKPGKLRKKTKIMTIMFAAFAILFFLISLYLINKYVISSSYLELEAAINHGCEELDPRTGCQKDPSKIIIPFDVDGDGVRGDENDTLEKILEIHYNCVGECVKRRCACPV